MAYEIRVPAQDELRPWIEAIELTFGEAFREERTPAYERVLERDRMLAAYDGSRIVGGGAAYSYGLTVPGGEVRAAGVSWVGVMPSHRRRGILTEMMRRQLDDVRGRGEPVAILSASEATIYGRYGYGCASLWASVEVARTRSGFRDRTEPEGRTRFVDRQDAARLFPPVYDRTRKLTPGFVTRTDAWWEVQVLDDPEYQRQGAGPKYYLLYETDDGPEGYVIYRIRSDWEWAGPKSVLEVLELVGATPRAERDLWRFCFDVDLIQTIRGGVLRPDHPLLLTVAEPRALRLTLIDGLWVRVVDVPGALEARGYDEAGSLILELSDSFIPETSGRWRLDVSDGRAKVGRTDEAPDLAIDITDLGAVYLGGSGFGQLARAGRGRECTPGAIERADAMFRTDQRPWCPQIF
jgi:predicted acetyltransferase